MVLYPVQASYLKEPCFSAGCGSRSWLFESSSEKRTVTTIERHFHSNHFSLVQIAPETHTTPNIRLPGKARLHLASPGVHDIRRRA